MVYRHKVRIVLDVLSAVKDGHEEGVGITKVMRMANLPYGRVVRVVEELVRVGLIEEIAGGGKFRITPSGLKLLDEWERFAKFAEGFGLQV